MEETSSADDDDDDSCAAIFLRHGPLPLSLFCFRQKSQDGSQKWQKIHIGGSSRVCQDSSMLLIIIIITQLSSLSRMEDSAVFTRVA